MDNDNSIEPTYALKLLKLIQFADDVSAKKLLETEIEIDGHGIKSLFDWILDIIDKPSPAYVWYAKEYFVEFFDSLKDLNIKELNNEQKAQLLRPISHMFNSLQDSIKLKACEKIIGILSKDLNYNDFKSIKFKYGSEEISIFDWAIKRQEDKNIEISNMFVGLIKNCINNTIQELPQAARVEETFKTVSRIVPLDKRKEETARTIQNGLNKAMELFKEIEEIDSSLASSLRMTGDKGEEITDEMIYQFIQQTDSNLSKEYSINNWDEIILNTQLYLKKDWLTENWDKLFKMLLDESALENIKTDELIRTRVARLFTALGLSLEHLTKELPAKDGEPRIRFIDWIGLQRVKQDGFYGQHGFDPFLDMLSKTRNVNLEELKKQFGINNDSETLVFFADPNNVNSLDVVISLALLLSVKDLTLSQLLTTQDWFIQHMLKFFLAQSKSRGSDNFILLIKLLISSTTDLTWEKVNDDLPESVLKSIHKMLKDFNKENPNIKSLMDIIIYKIENESKPKVRKALYELLASIKDLDWSGVSNLSLEHLELEQDEFYSWVLARIQSESDLDAVSSAIKIFANTRNFQKNDFEFTPLETVLDEISNTLEELQTKGASNELLTQFTDIYINKVWEEINLWDLNDEKGTEILRHLLESAERALKENELYKYKAIINLISSAKNAGLERMLNDDGLPWIISQTEKEIKINEKINAGLFAVNILNSITNVDLEKYQNYEQQIINLLLRRSVELDNEFYRMILFKLLSKVKNLSSNNLNTEVTLGQPPSTPEFAHHDKTLFQWLTYASGDVFTDKYEDIQVAIQYFNFLASLKDNNVQVLLDDNAKIKQQVYNTFSKIDNKELRLKIIEFLSSIEDLTFEKLQEIKVPSVEAGKEISMLDWLVGQAKSTGDEELQTAIMGLIRNSIEKSIKMDSSLRRRKV
ncbi:MAG: hypothetical protein ACD_79C00841G0001, partial [uncultured bacterium]